MGSEGSGLSKLLQEQCDYTVSIPTSGKIDSLNVYLPFIGLEGWKRTQI